MSVRGTFVAEIDLQQDFGADLLSLFVTSFEPSSASCFPLFFAPTLVLCYRILVVQRHSEAYSGRLRCSEIHLAPLELVVGCRTYSAESVIRVEEI